jgi:hypothetical protein
VQVFPDLSDMTVLDMGGTIDFWSDSPTRPSFVTLVNLSVERHAHKPIWAELVEHDACGFRPTRNYDLVISNSLIEHVGGPFQRRALAEIIQCAAERHWIQTPYRYFPVEPHYVLPGMQFLPLRARVAVAQRRSFGPGNRDVPYAAAIDEVQSVDLLSITEMHRLFPDSDLWIERWLGLPKSLIAIRTKN